jgi:phenylpyruvate tautomerase PptA (4-oxalocrotonate tautomerase family)
MPLVHVNRRAGRPREENAGVLEGIHAAIVEAFKTPMHDRTQLLSEHDPAHFEIPADRTAAYTLIEITAFPGRSVDAKRALYRGIVTRLEAIGIAPADVLIVLTEPPLESWSVRGGAAACDVKVAYKIDV